MTNLKTKFVRTRNRARALPAGTCLQEVSKRGRFAHALVRPAVLVAVSAILIGGARAADMPAADNMDFEQIASAGSIWTGPYLGIEAGGSHSFADVKAGGQKKDFSRFDAAFGVFGGYNWQVSRVIWGVEGSATYLGRNKKGQHPVLGSIETGSTWSVSAKTRVGLPINNFMPYLSIGLAASDHSLKANGRTKNSVGVGAVLGAGLEVAMHDKWRLRADYSLTGIIDNKDTFGGTQAKRTAGNHRLMVGISRAF